MPKKRIAIDFDDVLIMFVQHFISHHNTCYGTNLTYEAVTTFLLHDHFGISSDVFENRIWQYINSPKHLKITTVPYVHEVLTRLSRMYQLHIVTSRIEMVADATETLVRKKLPQVFESIHYTNSAGLHHDLPRYTKGEVCKKIGAHILIEDGPSHAQDAAAFDIRVLLMDRPWNRTEMPSGIERMYTWLEIESWILAHE